MIKDKSNLNVPSLRFKEFTGEWEKKNFDNVASHKKGKGLNRDCVSESGKPCILYGDLYTIYSKNTIINHVKHFTNDQQENFIYSKENDVIVPASGETSLDISVAGCVKQAGIILGSDLNILTPKTDVFGDFLAYQIKGIRKIDIAKVAQGNSVVHLNYSQLQKIDFFIPKMDEQTKISNFLFVIDKQIQMQKTLIANYQSLIKIIIDDIISKTNGANNPPMLLSDVLTERKEYCAKGNQYEHGSLTMQGVVPKTKRYDRDFLVRHENKKYKVCRYNDITYNPANLKFGVIARNSYKDIIFSPIYATFFVNSGYNPVYIELIVTSQNFINKALQYQQGTVFERMAVSPIDFLSLEIVILNKEIQDKISLMIVQLRKYVEIHELLLRSLATLKNHLLNKMFV